MNEVREEFHIEKESTYILICGCHNNGFSDISFMRVMAVRDIPFCRRVWTWADSSYFIHTAIAKPFVGKGNNGLVIFIDLHAT